MSTVARRREGRRIRRRAQGNPYTVTVTIYPDLTDFPLIYVVVGDTRYLLGEYKPRTRKRPILHNGRKPQ